MAPDLHMVKEMVLGQLTWVLFTQWGQWPTCPLPCRARKGREPLPTHTALLGSFGSKSLLRAHPKKTPFEVRLLRAVCFAVAGVR